MILYWGVGIGSPPTHPVRIKFYYLTKTDPNLTAYAR